MGDIDAGWDGERAEALVRGRRAGGRLAMTVDRQASEYRIWAEDHGLYRLAPSARRLDCAPPAGVPAWRWQRVLVGNVLPLAAVLAGHEALHAAPWTSAGAPWASWPARARGKTSLAMSLVRRGAGFVCDDVMALDSVPGGEVQAHPGPGLCQPPHRGGEPPRERRVQGARPRRRRGEGHAGPPRAPAAARPPVLRGARAASPAPRPPSPTPADPGLVLGATFNLVVRTEERLTRQLELASLVAAGAGLHRLAIPAGVGPDETAAAVEDHVREARG